MPKTNFPELSFQLVDNRRDTVSEDNLYDPDSADIRRPMTWSIAFQAERSIPFGRNAAFTLAGQTNYPLRA